MVARSILFRTSLVAAKRLMPHTDFRLVARASVAAPSRTARKSARVDLPATDSRRRSTPSPRAPARLPLPAAWASITTRPPRPNPADTGHRVGHTRTAVGAASGRTASVHLCVEAGGAPAH